MKRLGFLFATAFLFSFVMGCGGSSVPEGLPADAATANPQPPDFQKVMEAQGKNMTNQKKKPAEAPKK